MLAENAIDSESGLIITACDSRIIWEQEKFQDLVKQNPECIIWTFRNNPAVKRKPESYAYVKVSGNAAKFVSCKKTISENPMNDHGVTGTFYFRKAGKFFDGARDMVRKEIMANNEFYADTVPNELIDKGLDVRVFDAKQYVVFGTPADLKVYNYWENYFESNGEKK